MSLYQSAPFSKSPLTNADRAARSLSFGAEQPDRPHTVQREVGDLRSDVERAVLALEGRDAFPDLLTSTGGIGAANGTDSLVLFGRNFLAGRAQATARVGGVDYTACRPGTPGNAITIAVVAGNGVLSVDVAGDAITVTLADGGSTAAAIAAAVNASASAKKLVSAAAVAGAPDVTAAISATALSGGTGEGLKVISYYVADGVLTTTELTVSALITNSKITLTDAQLDGTAVNDRVAIAIESHTARTQSIVVTVA